MPYTAMDEAASRRLAQLRDEGRYAVVYSKVIEWTGWDGSKSRVVVGPYDTREEAEATALADARALGWAPRKWWQFWRWNDTP